MQSKKILHVLPGKPRSFNHICSLFNSKQFLQMSSTDASKEVGEIQSSSGSKGDNPSNPLSLPSFSGEGTTRTTYLDVSSGEAVKLDHLGPMVVNVDGTLSRIANWVDMADVEKKNTSRVIGKRNKARLEALRVGGKDVNSLSRDA